MSKIGTLQAALDQKRQELARLELELNTAQRSCLPQVYLEYGFESMDGFIRALSEFASPSLRSAIEEISAIQEHASPTAAAPRARKKRAVITNELRGKISAALQRQSEVAADIAKRFNVSVSAVNQLKRKLGLTKPD